MSVRRDKIQLEVEINGKRALSTVNEMKKAAKSLQREMNGLDESTEEYARKEKDLKKINDRLATLRRRTRGVAEGMDDAQRSTNRWTGLFRRFLPVAAFAAVGNAIGNVVGRIKDATEANAEFFDTQAKAEAQLLVALDGNIDALDRYKDKAREIQGLTLFGDEALIEQQAFLVNLGLTEQQVDKTLTAAVNMSAGLGMSLESATRNLAKTTGGLVGELGELIPDIRNLTKEELAAGKAIELVNEQFAGQAEAAAKVGTGPLTQINNKIGDLREQFGEFITKSLVRFAPLINGAIDLVSAFLDKLNLAPAFLAGLFRAGGQAVENIKSVTQAAGIEIELFYKKARRAISIRQSVRDRIDGEISVLEGQLQAANERYQTLSESFNEGYSKTAERIRQQDEKLAKELAAQAVKTDQKRVEDAKKTVEDVFKERLKALQVQHEREKLLIEGEYVRQEISEATHHEKLHAATLQYYQNQLTAFREFGKSSSNEAIKVQNELDAIRQRQNFQPVAALPTANLENRQVNIEGAGFTEASVEGEAERREQRLRNQFERAIITEQEYEELRLQNQADAQERRLELMELQGKEQSTQYLAAENELLNIQKQLNQKKLENAERTALLKRKAELEGLTATQNIFEAGASLLSQDEDARKKHATAIKAFEKGRILTNLYAEVSGYFKTAAGLPFVGQLLAASKAALATVRATNAIKAIDSQKFYSGGFTGRGYGRPDETGARPVGIVHENEYVIPAWMLGSPSIRPVVNNLERVRQRGYMDGGLATVDTTPRGDYLTDTGIVGGAGVSRNIGTSASDSSGTNDRLDRLIDAFSRFPREFRGKVVYEDLEEKREDLEFAQRKSEL